MASTTKPSIQLLELVGHAWKEEINARCQRQTSCRLTTRSHHRGAAGRTTQTRKRHVSPGLFRLTCDTTSPLGATSRILFGALLCILGVDVSGDPRPVGIPPPSSPEGLTPLLPSRLSMRRPPEPPPPLPLSTPPAARFPDAPAECPCPFPFPCPCPCPPLPSAPPAWPAASPGASRRLRPEEAFGALPPGVAVAAAASPLLTTPFGAAAALPPPLLSALPGRGRIAPPLPPLPPAPAAEGAAAPDDDAAPGGIGTSFSSSPLGEAEAEAGAPCPSGVAEWSERPAAP